MSRDEHKDMHPRHAIVCLVVVYVSQVVFEVRLFQYLPRLQEREQRNGVRSSLWSCGGLFTHIYTVRHTIHEKSCKSGVYSSMFHILHAHAI